MFTQGHSSELLGHGRSISEFDSSAHESVTPRTASPYPKVDLTCMPILQSVLNALPSDILRKYRIIPFSLDREGRRMRIACADPGNADLVNALTEYLPSISCEHYQADPKAVDQTLQRFFPGELPVALTETPNVEIKDVVIEPASTDEDRSDNAPRSIVLFATPHGSLSPHIMQAYEAERFEPRMVRTLDAVARLIEQAPIEVLFIHEDLRTRAELLLKSLQKQSSPVTVRFYRTESDLLLNTTSNEATLDLGRRNLHLLRHLLDSNDGHRAAHAASVAQLAERISTNLGLPTSVTESMLTAAFLHNLAEEDVSSVEEYTQPDLIALSASRLATWGYPGSVTDLLRGMSNLLADVDEPDSPNTSVAAEILAVVDHFCTEWPDHSALSVEQIQEIEAQLNQRFDGTISLRVLNELVSLVKSTYGTGARRQADFVVHICASEAADTEAQAQLLLRNGFKVESSRSFDECVAAAERVMPQALVIRNNTPSLDLNELLLSLALRGIRFDSIPTLLLINENAVAEAQSLLRHGIEDILPASISNDALVTKLKRIKERTEDRSRLRLAVLQDLGTHGSLEDMDLVDLLEAMRGNRRPVQISLTASGNHLTVIVDQGKVVLAECDGHRGIAAVMQGLNWKRGIWSIDPIIPEQLPKTSLNEPVDSILLEACVQLDNSAAGGK